MKKVIILLSSAIIYFGCGKKATQVVATPNPKPTHTIDSSLTYTANIKPLMNMYCVKCHKSETYGNQVGLNNYQDVKKYATNGEINKHVFVVKNMPPRNEPQLSTIELSQLSDWLKTGTKE